MLTPVSSRSTSSSGRADLNAMYPRTCHRFSALNLGYEMNYTKANSCNDRGTFHIRHYGTVRGPSRYRSLDHIPGSIAADADASSKAGHPHSRRVLLAKQMGAAV